MELKEKINAEFNKLRDAITLRYNAMRHTTEFANDYTKGEFHGIMAIELDIIDNIETLREQINRILDETQKSTTPKKAGHNSSSKKDCYDVEEYRRFANTPKGQKILKELGFKRSPS